MTCVKIYNYFNILSSFRRDYAVLDTNIYKWCCKNLDDIFMLLWQCMLHTIHILRHGKLLRLLGTWCLMYPHHKRRQDFRLQEIFLIFDVGCQLPVFTAQTLAGASMSYEYIHFQIINGITLKLAFILRETDLMHRSCINLICIMKMEQMMFRS